MEGESARRYGQVEGGILPHPSPFASNEAVGDGMAAGRESAPASGPYSAASGQPDVSWTLPATAVGLSPRRSRMAGGLA
jgi:hypothetical protein